ncbi:MAG: hypothetical protein V8T10_01765 [Merdibacter sp.]
MRLVQDLLWRAEAHELLQHMMTAGILGAGGQLAIGKCPCSPFPELHVALGIELSAGPEFPDAAGTCLHARAALQDDGTIAVLRQQQSGEHAGRAESDHDRAVRQTLAALLRQREGRRFGPGDIAQTAAQQRFFMAHLALQRIREHDRILAGVDAFPYDRKADQFILADPQFFTKLFFQLIQIFVDGQLHL